VDLDYLTRKQRAFALFHAINWLRETINAFSADPAADVKGKCIQRLGMLMELEKMLEHYLEYLSDVPTSEYVLGEISFLNEAASVTKTTVQFNIPQEESDEENRDQNMRDTVSVVSKDELASKRGSEGKAAAKKPNSLSDMRNCFRELQLRVLSLLTPISPDINIPPESAHYVLIDLREKLTGKLGAKKIARFGRKKKSSGFTFISEFSQMFDGELVSAIFQKYAGCLSSTLDRLAADCRATDGDGFDLVSSCVAAFLNFEVGRAQGVPRLPQFVGKLLPYVGGLVQRGYKAESRPVEVVHESHLVEPSSSSRYSRNSSRCIPAFA
jgi:hypothetical protein